MEQGLGHNLIYCPRTFTYCTDMIGMQRRDFLRGLRKPMLAAAAIPAIAYAAADRGKQAIDPHVAALRDRFETMNKTVNNRLDKLETSHKRMVKGLFALTALSLGIDVSSLI